MSDFGPGLVCGLLVAALLALGGCPHKYVSNSLYKEAVARCISFDGVKEVRGYSLPEQNVVVYICNDGSRGRATIPNYTNE